MKEALFRFIIFSAFLSAGMYTDAQIHITTAVPLPESVAEKLNVYQFENINKLYYYHDENKLEIIRKLEKKHDRVELHNALTAYVKNFGIGNFKRDTDLIWKLAKVTESLGDDDLAQSLYQLVLKHHHPNQFIIELNSYKDSISRCQNELYVPLDKYFELVQRSWFTDTVKTPHGEFVNLGKAINSPSADYAPTYSAKNHTLVFTSQRHTAGYTNQNSVNENLFISTKDENGKWSIAKDFDRINTKYNEGSGCLSADGKTLYFSRCNSPDSYGNCDLFVAQLKKDSTWGNVKNLGAKVNSTHWDSHPSLSHSEDTLYFASDRNGGFGLSDIYFTYKDSLGNWKEPQNMGPVINTRNHDVSPFYHPAFNVLYFSSAGQPHTFGEFDIYKLTKTIDGHWGKPVNAGPQVNHKGSEMYFTLDPETNLMFFARSLNHNLREQDLYSFPIPMEAHPEATTTLRGRLTDSITGIPLEGMVSILDLEHGVEIAPKYINKNGSFEFDLIDNRKYALTIRGKDFFRIENQIVLNGPTKLHKKAIPLDGTVTFASINFDFDSARLKTSMHADLNKVIKFLNDNPEFNLTISGHTDSEGTHAYNINLSRERARNIYKYILQAGIQETRVEYQGYGNTKPIAEEITKKHQAINRRVEFTLYPRDSERNGEGHILSSTNL